MGAENALEGAGGNAIVMVTEQGQLTARVDQAGSMNSLGSTLYDPTQQAWWRVRESGGTLFWETAPDGKTWTVQAQLSPLPFAIDTLDLHLGSGTWQTVPNPGVAQFDNLGLPPP